MATLKTEAKDAASEHILTVRGRKEISLEGVTDVHKCDEGCVILETVMGTLAVRGNGISLEKLDLEEGKMTVNGSFDSLEYKNGRKHKKTTLAEMFR